LIYICIPTYNEGPTVGVLLWRIRRVFQDYSREYEIVVYDDGSTDGTRETLGPYADVIPLTILRGEQRKGFGFALDRLAREVSRRTRYARRDAMILMQADFTDQPEHIPELVKLRRPPQCGGFACWRTGSSELVFRRPVLPIRSRPIASIASRFFGSS
jgi:glycosyltransferase involved in cell wall biosynthesis